MDFLDAEVRNFWVQEVPNRGFGGDKVENI